MRQTTSCPPGPPLKSPKEVDVDLKEELLGVDVVDEAGVVLIHHGQLVARRAHVQAAHGRGLLQQHDRQRVVHEDLQDLGDGKQRHSRLSFPRTGNSTADKSFCAV